MKAQFAVLVGLAVAAGASPAAEPAAKEAEALVEQGAAFLRSHGRAELVKRINRRDPMFYRGGLYLHLRDARTGITLAHPVHPWMIGQDLADLPDANGKKYRRDIIALAAAKGKGWVHYTYKNPADGRAEPRSDYIIRVGALVLESGLESGSGKH